MPTVTFSLESSDRLLPRRAMTWHANATMNGIVQPNCSLCTTPVLANQPLLFLVIELSYTEIMPGFYSITITLRITNNHTVPLYVTVAPGDFTPAGIFWHSISATVAAGQTDTSITGSLEASAGIHTVTGFITGDEVPPVAVVTSNTAQSAITVP